MIYFVLCISYGVREKAAGLLRSKGSGTVTENRNLNCNLAPTVYPPRTCWLPQISTFLGVYTCGDHLMYCYFVENVTYSRNSGSKIRNVGL